MSETHALKNNKGSALITAMIVSLVIAVLCLAMLGVSYSAFISADADAALIPEREYAYSVLDTVGKELKEGAESGLAGYVNRAFMGGWKSSEDEAMLFEMQGAEKSGLTVKIKLFWEDKEQGRILNVNVMVYSDDEQVFSLSEMYEPLDEQSGKWGVYDRQKEKT